MKRLIIDLEADDFRAILAALLKTNANFTVENLTPLIPQEPAPRTVQRKTNEGLTASDLVVNTLVERHKVHKHEMARILQDNGFAKNTVHGVASKLHADGLLRKDGDYYVEVKGTPRIHLS